MIVLFNRIYCSLRKKELEVAMAKFKKMKVDAILQRLTKLCWKNNIQYKVLIKTKNTLIIELIGSYEDVLFKYHKTDMVSKEQLDFFMNSIDEKKAHKGVYITTGIFERKDNRTFSRKKIKRDIILEDCFSFTKNHLGIKGNAKKNFQIDRLNLFKYLPQ